MFVLQFTDFIIIFRQDLQFQSNKYQCIIAEKDKITVQGTEITIVYEKNDYYICLTDIYGKGLGR